MEGFLSTFPPHSVCAVPAQDSGWGKREGRFMIPMQGLNYLELCKAILAQVHPGAQPPPNTRECGVQVNAKVDKIVQCSLGPKTLFCVEGDPTGASRSPGRSPGRSPELGTPDGKALHNTPLGQLRFRRPVSIYSPVFDRRLFSKQPDDEGSEGDSGGQAAGDEDGEAEHSGEDPVDPVDPVRDFKTTIHRSLKGSNFQVYYKQLCRKCQVGFNPYRVESILCKGCSQTCCSCEKKQRHINMKRPHRQDLCCRCKGTRLSCDATYSFKYIV
ncbi:Zygote arrest protein 1 [Liparis tanakae]|uniref:Zygote arrest protein 1 n=1 Tax=Liparis tanakae TaxID=230148 RepID=A0A4Z2GPM5_9TELE|nr:Zygote arrest protein 1 [Liparis tanakae]